MKKLRSRIFKIWIILLICSGLVTTLVKPVDAARANKDFTKWLQSLAKKTRTSDLQGKFASLKESKEDIGKLIEQASHIVSQNNEDFNLPRHAATDNIQQILVVEWNQYQTGNDAMAALPSVEIVKPLVISPQQKLLPLTAGLLPLKMTGLSSGDALLVCGSTIFYANPAMTPMVHGIAIGAP